MIRVMNYDEFAHDAKQVVSKDVSFPASEAGIIEHAKKILGGNNKLNLEELPFELDVVDQHTQEDIEFCFVMIPDEESSDNICIRYLGMD